MSPAEIRVIHRLSARSNILPVISRADSLTDEKFLAAKNTEEGAPRWTVVYYMSIPVLISGCQFKAVFTALLLRLAMTF